MMTHDNHSGTPQPCCATIGFFDGVHRGHQFLLSRLNEVAHASGMSSMAITFDRHPRQVVQTGYVPQLITTCREKVELLRNAGVDRVEVLHFDSQMAQLSAREFMEQVLSRRLGVDRLLIGYDNRFGHNRTEGFDDYVAYGREIGMSVERNTPLDIDGLRVSSSLVRRLIASGDTMEASRCLGRPYAITGTVAHGFEEGRKIGFPTANIVPQCKDQILPLAGVYAVEVSVDGGGRMPAMMNIGNNPTFGRRLTTLEAHILNFNGDIYGHEVRVEFGQRLRDERKFESIEQLRRQLESDLMAVESISQTNS